MMSSMWSMTSLAVWADGAQPLGKVSSPGSRREVKVSFGATESMRVRTERYNQLMGCE